MQHHHENEVELLRVEHLREMNELRQKYLDEVRAFGFTSTKQPQLWKWRLPDERS